MATRLYDAIVSSDIKMGDYLLPSAAFADGKQSIFVRRGTYVETADVIIPNGGSMIGESRNGVILSFTGTSFGVICDSEPSSIQTAGTVSLINNTTSVTGTGTTFTVLNPGDQISIGSVYMAIASITDDTNLTLRDTYRGAPLSNVSYQALKMFSAVGISNVIIVNSLVTGLYINGCREFTLESIGFYGCTPNLYIENSGDATIDQIVSLSSNGVGITISNSLSISSKTLESINSTSHGISFTGTNLGMLINDAESSNNGGAGIYVNGTCSDASFSKCTLKSNVSLAMYISSSCMAITVNDSDLSSNGTDGININGNNIVFSGNIVNRNVGNGIVINGNECIVTRCVVNDSVENINVSGNNNIVIGNISRNSGMYCLHIMIGATNNICTYNNLAIAGYGPINDEGDSSDTTGNRY